MLPWSWRRRVLSPLSIWKVSGLALGKRIALSTHRARIPSRLRLRPMQLLSQSARYLRIERRTALCSKAHLRQVHWPGRLWNPPLKRANLIPTTSHFPTLSTNKRCAGPLPSHRP